MQEPSLYSPLPAVVPCPSRILLYISPLPQQWTAPQEHLPFCPHYRSSVRSRRSSLSISTAAAVTAPARSSLSLYSTAAAVTRARRSATCISHYRCRNAPLRSATPYFLTAPAVSAPAGALPKFPHCPQQCSLQQEAFPSIPSPSPPTPPPPLYFSHCRSSACSSRSLPPPPLTPLYFSHCRSSACSSRSLSPPPPLPSPSQQPPRHHGNPPPSCFFTTAVSACSSRNLLSIFPTTEVVPAPTGFFSICPHCPSSDRSRRSAIYFPTTQ